MPARVEPLHPGGVRFLNDHPLSAGPFGGGRARWLIWLASCEAGGSREKFELAAGLTDVMVPYILLISLTPRPWASSTPSENSLRPPSRRSC